MICDRDKLRADAIVSVKECWLVLGPEKTIEMHRQPENGQFAASTVHGPGGMLASTVVPGFNIDLDRLFGV